MTDQVVHLRIRSYEDDYTTALIFYSLCDRIQEDLPLPALLRDPLLSVNRTVRCIESIRLSFVLYDVAKNLVYGAASSRFTYQLLFQRNEHRVKPIVE